MTSDFSHLSSIICRPVFFIISLLYEIVNLIFSIFLLLIGRKNTENNIDIHSPMIYNTKETHTQIQHSGNKKSRNAD